VLLRLKECPVSAVTPDLQALLNIAFDARTAHAAGWALRDPESEIPEVILYDALLILQRAEAESRNACEKAISAK
jgi:hypothetical protein